LAGFLGGSLVTQSHHPAGARHRFGGAMATTWKLAGVRWLLVSEHRFKKEKHHRNEELTANSRWCFAGAEERREELAARGKALGLRRDPVWWLL